MNVIGLTGADPHAMADAAELLLGMAAGSAHRLVVMLYIDCPIQARVLRAGNNGRTEIWRIGDDPDRACLDHLVDVRISDEAHSLPRAIENHLMRFIHHAGQSQAAPTFN